jgi:hypothetical protein
MRRMRRLKEYIEKPAEMTAIALNESNVTDVDLDVRLVQRVSKPTVLELLYVNGRSSHERLMSAQSNSMHSLIVSTVATHVRPAFNAIGGCIAVQIADSSVKGGVRGASLCMGYNSSAPVEEANVIGPSLGVWPSPGVLRSTSLTHSLSLYTFARLQYT